MKKLLRSALFALLVLPLGSGLNIALMAASLNHDSVIIKKCRDFTITGDGSAEQWKNTAWIRLARQNKDTAAFRTKTKVLYSEKGLYFLFSCADEKITSTMKADNLNLYEEDVVEIFLWPDETFPVYFEYELSPYNFELPIIVPNKKGNFLGWLPWHYDGDRKTKHATSILHETQDSASKIKGWIAEFFIPFDLLTPLISKAPAPGTRWRANLYRIDYDNGVVPYSWQKTKNTFHEYQKFGTFIFDK
jgi:hypothetical protein